MDPSIDRYSLRLGTRGSRLAVAQSQQIADALMLAHAGLDVQLIVCRTTGDRVVDRPLQDIGGKGLFIKEIEEALLAREIDCAVHSYKDVPVTEPLVDESELIVAAVPLREDARDVLIAAPAISIAELARGARVGTGSLRRRSQLLQLRPDLNILPIRGNIDTRIAKIRVGAVDAVILALAGVNRSGLFDAQTMTPLSYDQMLPAAAQGALALQCRREDSQTIDLLKQLDHAETRACVELERAVVAALNGDCHSPIAASATIENATISLRANVAKRDGNLPIIQAAAHAALTQAHEALKKVVAELERQGVRQLLA